MTTFKCPACGEKALSLRTGAGRTMRHRNMEVAVPDDFALPECTACGARPLDMKTVKRLDPILEQAYADRLCAAVEADIDALAGLRPLYEWERVLNLSAGYLSKLRGSKTPSAQLAALLRLLANHPERARELESLWAGEAQSVILSEQLTLSATPLARPARPTPLRLVDRQEFTIRRKAA